MFRGRSIGMLGAMTPAHTEPSRLSRFGAASGAAGAVVYAVSAFAAGTPLKPDASLSRVIAYLSDRRGGLLLGDLLALLALALLVWFLGYLRAFLAEVEGGKAPLASITLVSWLALLLIVLAGNAPLVAVVWRGAGVVDPQIARFAFDASNVSLYSLSATAVIVSVLAPIILIWRSKALPRWLVPLGALEIVVNAVELAGLFARTGNNAAGYAFGVGPFVWVVWVVAVSIAMVTRPPLATATA
jgi:hypothetical protein